jgi:hypothetical protein
MTRARGARQAVLIQIRALLLFAVFLGAGTTLPGLDALLYHTRGPDLEGSRIHLEPAGPCPDHAAHCSLGRAAPGSRAVSAGHTIVRSESSPRATRTPAPLTPSLVSERRTPAQPRAPPVPIV